MKRLFTGLLLVIFLTTYLQAQEVKPIAKDLYAAYLKGDYHGSLTKLATELYISGEKEKAHIVAENYLKSLSAAEIYTKENLKFFAGLANSANSKIFKIFYGHEEKVDKVMGEKKYAQWVVDYYISNDEIDKPYINPNVEKTGSFDLPWKKMYESIATKFTKSHADRITTGAKARWYFNRNWPEYCKNRVAYLEKYDRPDSKAEISTGLADGLNNEAWAIFEHCNHEDHLKAASGWLKIIIDHFPQDAPATDTYANLLYKLGRKEEAIKYQEKAVTIDPDNKDMRTALEKMKDGRPTWPAP